MVEAALRRLSTAITRAALRVCPAHMQDWGQAMLAELSFIESPWATLRWAIGSARVVVWRAVASHSFGKEAAMRRPRVLFSVGLVLLPLAVCFLAMWGWYAYRYFSRAERVDATVVSVVGSRTFTTRLPKILRLPWSKVRDGPPQTMYQTGLKVEFDDHGYRRTVRAAISSTDSEEHERLRREYAVGTRHSMRLERNFPVPRPSQKPMDEKLQKVLGADVTLYAPESDIIPGVYLRVLLAAFSAVLLTAGMVYLGKRRSI